MEITGIGRFVKGRRHQLGLRQQDVAERGGGGLTPARVAQIERGDAKLPNAEHRRALARALQVRHVDLLIAAGEVTEEEVSGAVRPADLSEPEARLHAKLDQVPMTQENVAFLDGVLTTLARPPKSTVQGVGNVRRDHA